jgi:hypothetical protein
MKKAEKLSKKVVTWATLLNKPNLNTRPVPSSFGPPRLSQFKVSSIKTLTV